MAKKHVSNADQETVETEYLSQTLSGHDATDESAIKETTLDVESELTLKSNLLDEEDEEVEESGALFNTDQAVDQNSDAPEAGTPGHPGIDDDTA